MKNVKVCVALIMCLVICGCLAACGSEKTERIGVDVSYYANLGKIKECDFALGDNGEALVAQFNERISSQEDGEDELHEHSDADSDEIEYCNTYEGDGYVSVDIPGMTFRYDSESKKIYRIASMKEAYGFKIGTVSIEIQKAMSSYGLDSEERSLTEEERLMVAGAESDTCLEYKFGDNYVLFFFSENALYATVIYSGE